MITLSSIINTFQADFLEQYRSVIRPVHCQALAAMKHCRTASSPHLQAHCLACDSHVCMPHSCGHRFCPHCQHHESQQWLERQLKKQLPAEYFLITFTLPQQLRTLAWHHPRTLYALMTRCAWDTVRTFAHNDRQLQGMPGAITVLHTHSRRLDYHPHIHMVMPAAAIDAEKKRWRTKTGKKSQHTAASGYLFNHKALANVFRAKLLDAIRHEHLQLPVNIPDIWVVDVKSVGTGEKALIYLGRYLYKGVIQESDIIACKNGQVTFRYQISKTKRTEYRTVSGPQFLWLILQHVLPKGFRRARNFGFLHPNSKRLIAVLQYQLGFDPQRALAWLRPRPQFVCRTCKAAMVIVQTRIPRAAPVPITQHGL